MTANQARIVFVASSSCAVASSTGATVNAGRDTRGGLLSVTFSSEVTVDSG